MAAYWIDIIIVVIYYLHVSSNVYATEHTDCNFASGFCGWTHDVANDFNWTITTGDTRKPDADRTPGDGYYASIEMSDLWKNDDKARIISPLQVPGYYCMSVWYYTHGSIHNVLNVYLQTNDTLETTMFTRRDLVDEWLQSAIEFHFSKDDKIVIEGVVEESYSGGIAIDDIYMASGHCSVDCTFDQGMCGWTQDKSDDFDWTRNTGGTVTWQTGPEGDHTSESGFYIYLEATFKAENDTARIISPHQDPGQQCLTFWYHMYGQHINILNVYLTTSKNPRTILFSKMNAQGQQWYRTDLDVNSTDQYQIVIEGIIGESYQGDIAVDDIAIKQGSCFAETMSTSTPSTSPTVTQTTTMSTAVSNAESSKSINISTQNGTVFTSTPSTSPTVTHISTMMSTTASTAMTQTTTWSTTVSTAMTQTTTMSTTVSTAGSSESIHIATPTGVHGEDDSSFVAVYVLVLVAIFISAVIVVLVVVVYRGWRCNLCRRWQIPEKQNGHYTDRLQRQTPVSAVTNEALTNYIWMDQNIATRTEAPDYNNIDVELEYETANTVYKISDEY